MEILYQIWLSYAVFGIVVQNDLVVEAAPIGKWMIGKNIEYVKKWVEKKHGSVHKIIPQNN
jgi:hypothetical protein